MNEGDNTSKWSGRPSIEILFLFRVAQTAWLSKNDILQGLFVLPTVCSVEQSLALSAAAAAAAL